MYYIYSGLMTFFQYLCLFYFIFRVPVQYINQAGSGVAGSSPGAAVSPTPSPPTPAATGTGLRPPRNLTAVCVRPLHGNFDNLNQLGRNEPGHLQLQNHCISLYSTCSIYQLFTLTTFSFPFQPCFEFSPKRLHNFAGSASEIFSTDLDPGLDLNLAHCNILKLK